MVDSPAVSILDPPSSTVVSVCPQPQGSLVINGGVPHVELWDFPFFVVPFTELVVTSWAAKFEVAAAGPVFPVVLQNIA